MGVGGVGVGVGVGVEFGGWCSFPEKLVACTDVCNTNLVEDVTREKRVRDDYVDKDLGSRQCSCPCYTFMSFFKFMEEEPLTV